MLGRDGNGITRPFIGVPIVFLFFILWWVHHEPSTLTPSGDSITLEPLMLSTIPGRLPQEQSVQIPIPDDLSNLSPELRPHHELFSLSTANKHYFPIVFWDKKAINPNILPHPQLEDTYIIIGQQQRSDVEDSVWCAELVCNAKFALDVLACTEPPSILPISATFSDKCTGKWDFLGSNIGPHDARAFYGPNGAYVVYGSNSQFTCFGQWMQDLRTLVDWGSVGVGQEFRLGTELQRQEPWGQVEKNWFVFWDKDDQLYVHWDIEPKRSFAKLNSDGTVGKDLAGYAKTDKQCMAQYMPPIGPVLENRHQATNSLSITTCNRNDPNCTPDDFNTFIISIFQFKSFHAFHSVYEPYVMMMQRHAPFAVHAIGAKPLWISGRGGAGKGRVPKSGWDEATRGPWNQTEMLFVTSISWKAHGARYHGYADDVMFLAFGIEDEKTGGIDILAGDLLADLNFCQLGPSVRDVGSLG